MKISSEKIKIKDLLELRRNNILLVNPEYQRGAVWGLDQQRRLIDSVMRGYPLPLFYFHVRQTKVGSICNTNFEIIDGQQRTNAISDFADGQFRLFDPVADEKRAKFPDFIKHAPCSWAHCNYPDLTEADRIVFDDTEIFIAKIETEVEDEARDLLIRLQAGLPLNPQEKRDAWPGGFTDFVLHFGGKKEISRYPGHDFFKTAVESRATDRGDVRTLCAQIAMLLFENATAGNWKDISTPAIDDYYYRNLGFDTGSEDVQHFKDVLDVLSKVFQGYNGKKLKSHEAIHLVLFVSSLIQEYANDWRYRLISAFDQFREQALIGKKTKSGEFWNQYSAWTIAQASNAGNLQRRHAFFVEQMLQELKPVKKDSERIYSQLEREIIFYRDRKLCAVCGLEVNWMDLEIHHLLEHHKGGQTDMQNGVSVHKQCHPKGAAATEFYDIWKEKQLNKNRAKVSVETLFPQSEFDTLQTFKIDNPKKEILAHGQMTETNKFMILKGSSIAREVSDSFHVTAQSASRRRENLIADGSINSDFIFTRDVLFNSKSNAASLVLGFSANGNVAWVASDV